MYPTINCLRKGQTHITHLVFTLGSAQYKSVVMTLLLIMIHTSLNIMNVALALSFVDIFSSAIFRLWCFLNLLMIVLVNQNIFLFKNPLKIEIKLVSKVKNFSILFIAKKLDWSVFDIQNVCPIFPDIQESEGEKLASWIFFLSQIMYLSKKY